MKVPGDGHCIIHCMANHFNMSVEVIFDLLQSELFSRFDQVVSFTYSTSNKPPSKEQVISEFYEYKILKRYSTDTVDMVFDLLTMVFQCEIFIYIKENERLVLRWVNGIGNCL